MSELIGLSVQLQADKAIESVGSIKKAMREAQKEVQVLSDKFGATSKEAINAAKVAGELKDRIGDAKALTDAFNPDAKFKAFSSSIAGVASGFAALQGAMGLFGAESEEVQKTLLKVQSAMAISQGLQSVGESIDAFKQLGAVISQSTVVLKTNSLATKAAAAVQRALGISVDATSVSFRVLKGAIIATGIGALVVLLGEAVSAFQNYASKANDAANAQAELNKKIQEGNDNALKAETDAIDRNTKLLVAKAKLAKKSEDEIFKIEQDGRRLKAEALAKAGKDIADANIEGQIAAIDNQTRLNKIEEDAQKERDRKAKEAREKRLAEEKKNEELLAASRLKNRMADTSTINPQELIDEAQAIRDAEVKAEQDKNNAILASQQQALAGRKGVLMEEANAVSATAASNIEVAKKEAEAKSAALQYTAQAIMNLSMIAGRETVAGKALAVAASLINTYQAITAQLKIASGSPGAAIPGWAIAQAIATGIAGLAAVKQIVSVQVPGGGGGGSAPSSVGISASSPLSAPIASQQTTLDQRSINAIGNRAIRAYVVESEISNAQQKVRRIQRQTTF